METGGVGGNGYNDGDCKSVSRSSPPRVLPEENSYRVLVSYCLLHGSLEHVL